MATNAAVLLVTDVSTLPESVEQWVNKTYDDKLSGGAAVQVLTSVQESGKHSCDIVLFYEAGIDLFCGR